MIACNSSNSESNDGLEEKHRHYQYQIVNLSSKSGAVQSSATDKQMKLLKWTAVHALIITVAYAQTL